MRKLFITGVIGFLVCLLILGITILLPIALGPNVSWGEAAIVMIPVAGLAFAFLVIMLVGLVGVVNAKADRWDDEEDDRPRRRGRQ